MDNIKDTKNTIKALSDENRLRIALMLKNRPMCVCEINELLDIALSTVSAHLKSLKHANIIKDFKDGRWIIYSINAENKLAGEILESCAKHLADDDTFVTDKKKSGKYNQRIMQYKKPVFKISHVIIF